DDPRSQPRARNDGAPAGAQHAPVPMGEEPAPAEGAARVAYLPTGSSGRRNPLGRTSSSSRAVGRLDHGGGDRREPARARRRRSLPRAHGIRLTADEWTRRTEPSGQSLAAG